ncbi:class I SAM-dependent methyltransferase [Holospora curviuscula]|uniref:Bifunctional 3-demethylubiquinone-9 3-methyltransferase/ 2-octaprenyl-6-hydroxy phenol methylase n=1 Tax=Holospora curviuscula TaxID=1082868 RepID=A0A2S5R7N7_9PROT|nr:class I SAM-dependent methyltransferase [Holospora curviuscula]PPE03135.1 bifunctional 3-demethylubiquinone-9 3-methyltransferase/ 2-octaprenyl-6-hydroxy phenol methylase [Holospora curviuscula]
MLICPDCRFPIALSKCSNCTWSLKYIENLPVYLKSKNCPLIENYIKCYEKISTDDLQETILPKAYIRHQAQKLIRYLPNSKDIKICDLGVGQGMLANSIRQQGFMDVTVVDIAIPYLKLLERDFKAIVSDAENLPFIEEFDYIFSTDVMEHVINIGSFLFSVNKALKKNGVFIFRVPDRENLMQYTPYMGCKYDFVHLRSFNSELLQDFMKNAGFSIKRLEYDGYWTYSYKNFVTKNKIFNFLYSKIYPKITHHNFILDDNYFNKIFCFLFLKPLEILCIAEKIKDL